jgi:putative zinc finger/helix-turn-helix YgiT family protein
MKGICPVCEKVRDIEEVTSREQIKVRSELIEVESKHFKCSACGNSFDDPGSTSDSLETAYREYRKFHGMTQPEEIKTLRKKYGFTQGEFSAILGWGIATLNRYEKGALQDEVHEKILKLAMDPKNLVKLIQETPAALNKDKRERLLKELYAEEAEGFSFERVLEEQYGRYEPGEFSGYRRFEIAKLFNAVLYFSRGEGVLKTKLNKLLFYMDFKHFKDYSVSVTGARYAHITFGPAPDKFQNFFAVLIDSEALGVEEIEYNEDIAGEKYFAKKNPDMSLYSDSEIKVMATVNEFFSDYTAGKITKFSHEEQGYKDTNNGDLISYKYADHLKV